MQITADVRSVEIRDIKSASEMVAVEDLQIEVWGDDPRDIVPVNQLVAAVHVGGSLIGAFDGARLIGFAYGFYGHVNSGLVHHSHMLGVAEEYRRLNVGFRLKAAQREKVLNDGLTTLMTWSFDPLQSQNAYFNFSKLGVVSDTYKVDVYGDQGTSFLHQNGTDRLFVTWPLASRRVERLLDGSGVDRPRYEDELADRVRLLRCSENEVPEAEASVEELGENDIAGIQIPSEIISIERNSPDLARRWRQETRRLFVGAIARGYLVVAYIYERGRPGEYLLKRSTIADELYADAGR